MKITRIEISNFLAIKSATLELADRGLLLIQGVNAEDSSADSNGAGKSSIVDAICWGLYGTTARDVTGDDVVNDTAKKECCVHIHLDDGAKQYRVIRWRKSSTYKNQTFVWEKDVATGAEVELTKATERDTQEVINAIMGCSLDVFTSAIYAGQEKMPDLPGMTDKLLKTLIEEAAGVEVLTAAYSIARDRYNKAKAEVDAVASRQITLINNGVSLDSEVARLRGSEKDFEDGRRERAKTELAKVVSLNAEIAKKSEEIAALNEPAIRKELDECQAKLDAAKPAMDEYVGLVELARKADTVAGVARAAAYQAKDKFAAAEMGLKRIDDKVGKPCDECGKVYVAEDMEVARNVAEIKLKQARQAAQDAAVEFKNAKEAADKANSAATSFKDAMVDVTAVAQQQRELSGSLNRILGLKGFIESYQAEIVNVKKMANVKLTEPNPWTNAVTVKEQERDRNMKALDDCVEKLEKLTEDLELLADSVKVFGPAGVRAHILDTVTPYLNDRTQEYLGALADGNIHAAWSTLTKTAKGELKEKFNIEVTNDKGAKSFKGLSGGEKRKVRLSTAMALQDMVASRATKPIDLFVADEVDHALDESGLERLMTVLERKARERGTVLVISHNSLSDWIDNVITVTKNGGSATVTGATENGA